MAFNIWERWPWTSFQNLNLDWLMRAMKEAVTKAEAAEAEVDTYSDRINNAQTAAANAQTIASNAQTAAANAQTAAANAQTAAANAQTAAANAQQSADNAADAAADARALAENAVLYTPEEGRTTFEKAQARRNIAAGHYNIGVSDDETLLTIVNLETNDVSTYNINKGQSFLVTVLSPSPGVFQVNRTAEEIRTNLHNLSLRYGLNEGVEINSYEVYGSPPIFNIRFTVLDPESSSVNYVEYILTLYREEYLPQDPAEDVVTVTRNLYRHNIGGGSLPDTTNAAAGDFLRLDSNKNAVWEDGNKPREVIAASSAAISPLSPNTLYVFTGDAAALNITLAAPANNNVENEYHFIFNSGSTPTTLTLPNTIRQPDGFTVEANHVYEVSILEDNMTAQGWTVTP